MGDEERRDELGPVDRAVVALVSDPALRPLAIVCVLIAGTFLAGAVLLVLRSRNPYAAMALFILVFMTLRVLDEDRRRRAITPSSWALLAVWVVTGLISGALVAVGVF